MALTPRCDRCRKSHYADEVCASAPTVTVPASRVEAPIETFDAAARSRWGKAMARQRWAKASPAERLAEGQRLTEARVRKERNGS